MTNTHIATAKCKTCKQIITSTGGGKFLYCKCKKSFIDQERFSALYVRLGGDAEFIEQVCPSHCTEEQHKDNKKQSMDKKEISKVMSFIGSKKTDKKAKSSRENGKKGGRPVVKIDTTKQKLSTHS